MKRFELLLCMLFLSLLSTGQNYTSTCDYMVEKVYLEATPIGTGVRSVINVTYYDGFHRKLQQVSVLASPDRSSDIIIPFVYGIYGRVEKEFLPYNKTDNYGALDGNASNVLNWDIYGSAEAAYAFTLIDYENGLDDRVVKRTGPGAAWHEAGKGVATAYGFNAAGEVLRYRAALDGTLTIDGTYPGGTLRKVTVTDEDGSVVETFTGGQDQVLLTASVSGDDRLETYSVYDARGLLRHVLSPEASFRMRTTINETDLRELAYRYDYDRKGRLVVKRLPGCDPVYMVYDRKDRLVMSQDGKQRTENVNKWSYSLYDGKNRVIETGEVVLSAATTHASLQATASTSLSYTPSGMRAALQYTLYDTYTATTNVPVHPFVATSGYTSTPGTLVTGLVTSVKTRVLDMPTETWLTTTTYYDDRCRVIQTVSDNLHGRLSRVDLKYDFTGNVVQQRESHSISVSQTDVLESVNVYDDRGRLLSTATRLNNGSPATVTCTYDAVGRLVSRKLGGVTETMSYNAKGWLVGKESVPFKMKLRYENPAGGTAARWNGNVCEWEWQQGTSVALMYGFAYDGESRLSGTTQKQKSGTSWVDLASSYLEQGLAYDRNGNIKTLRRTAGGNLVDNLVYTYTGNQLMGLTENVRTSPIGDIYLPGSTVTGSYTYDKNGNMTNDSRRALNLSYNVLNLLREVKTTSGVLKARYNYLADGTKLRVRNNGEANGFDYLGSLTYKQSSAGLQLESASFGDGVIRSSVSNSGGSEVNYFLTDHLGSVRVIVDASGVVTERNDYYPFGAKHVRGDYPQLADNRYKYNGKEEQVTGDLDYLDYGWRMYDSGLGRWFGMDKLSEEYKLLSPYNYVSNNPVNVVDPNGTYMDWFMNELTGDIYYNSDFRKGDESKIGKNWTWMGPNGMFDPENTNPFAADLRVLYSSGIGYYGSVGAIRYDENGNLKLFSEVLFKGDNARKFMQKQDYSLKAKVYNYHYDVITDFYPEVDGPMSITQNNSQMGEIRSYQYVHKSERLVESRVLRVYRTMPREFRPIGFSPVLRQREQQWRLQQNFYSSRWGLSSEMKDLFWDAIPWRFVYEEFIGKLLKKKK